jgi:hypothetical protein
MALMARKQTRTKPVEKSTEIPNVPAPVMEKKINWHILFAYVLALITYIAWAYDFLLTIGLTPVILGLVLFNLLLFVVYFREEKFFFFLINTLVTTALGLFMGIQFFYRVLKPFLNGALSVPLPLMNFIRLYIWSSVSLLFLLPIMGLLWSALFSVFLLKKISFVRLFFQTIMLGIFTLIFNSVFLYMNHSSFVYTFLRAGYAPLTKNALKTYSQKSDMTFYVPKQDLQEIEKNVLPSNSNFTQKSDDCPVLTLNYQHPFMKGDGGGLLIEQTKPGCLSEPQLSALSTQKQVKIESIPVAGADKAYFFNSLVSYPQLTTISYYEQYYPHLFVYKGKTFIHLRYDTRMVNEEQKQMLVKVAESMLKE